MPAGENGMRERERERGMGGGREGNASFRRNFIAAVTDVRR